MFQFFFFFFNFLFLRMGLDKASGLPYEIGIDGDWWDYSGETMGNTEIMATQNRGDGEDQLKQRLMAVVVVAMACIAIVMKGFDQIWPWAFVGGGVVRQQRWARFSLLSLWLQGIWRLDCGFRTRGFWLASKSGFFFFLMGYTIVWQLSCTK